jgi:XTP/dITP diphosphohydrolase
MFDLVIGSGNAHKVVELRALLPANVFRLTSLAELPDAIDVDETGQTFAENARLKAVEQAKHLGRWVLAEDSGLEVDALGGKPGVLSARFAGKHGDDAANNRLLLEMLANVPDDKRTAAFRCFVCVAAPDGTVAIEVDDACRGIINRHVTGDDGFGYDPLFTIAEYHLTFAQLGIAVKNVLSHRSRALRKLLPRLIELAEKNK